MAAKGNRHAWTQLEEHPETGKREKREVRANRFGKQWTFQSKWKRDEEWVQHEKPLTGDLEELYRILYRKYQRKHISWEVLEEVEKLLNERDVTIEDF